MPTFMVTRLRDEDGNTSRVMTFQRLDQAVASPTDHAATGSPLLYQRKHRPTFASSSSSTRRNSEEGIKRVESEPSVKAADSEHTLLGDSRNKYFSCVMQATSRRPSLNPLAINTTAPFARAVSSLMDTPRGLTPKATPKDDEVLEALVIEQHSRQRHTLCRGEEAGRLAILREWRGRLVMDILQEEERAVRLHLITEYRRNTRRLEGEEVSGFLKAKALSQRQYREAQEERAKAAVGSYREGLEAELGDLRQALSKEMIDLKMRLADEREAHDRAARDEIRDHFDKVLRRTTQPVAPRYKFDTV